VPKTAGKCARFDAARACQQSLAHEPWPSQAEVSVEAHALVSLNRIVHGSYRDADMSRKFSAVDRTPDATGQRLPGYPGKL
jgi:hypothetical protein